MTDKIEPALSAEEWARKRAGKLDLYSAFVEDNPGDTPRIIASLNDDLPDSDPRKITRHTVWIIRTLIRDAWIDMQHPGAIEFHAEANRLADALESYLPPESA